ncbi:MAG: hypothetical protein ABEJ57_04550 [Halobacteriaceae archaeon]
MYRRQPVLALMVATLLVTAGCGGVIPGSDGGGADAGAALDTVPAKATGIVYVDVDGLLQSDAHRDLTNTYLSVLANQSAGYSGPTTAEEAIAQAKNESGLDPSSIDAITAFSAADAAGDYSGVIVTGSFTESEFVTAQSEQQTYNFTETTYAGQPFYKPKNPPRYADTMYIGVLGDGKVVTGSEAAVKDAIDVSVGNADAISGAVKTAFQNSRDGFIRFGATVPQDQLPTDAANRSLPVDASVYSKVTTVWGAHYVSGDTVGATFTMQATSADAATDIRDVTDGAVSLASGYVSSDTAKEQLRNITVTKDGDTVTVTFENSVSALQSVIKTLLGSDT